MTWTEIWMRVLTFLGGSAAIMTGISWLCNKVLTHIFDKRTEDFKKKLEQDFERFKMELQKEALEHQVQFTRVDERVANALHKVYTPLRRFLTAASSYVSPVDWAGEPSKEEKLKVAAQINREFDDELISNQLYIPPTLLKRTQSLATEIATICNEFSDGLRKENNPRYDGEGEHWMAGFAAIRDKALPLLADITTEFQKRLGVQD